MTIETPSKHITEQTWLPDFREDGIYLVGEDGSTIAKLCRPDAGSDVLLVGYIVGLQTMNQEAWREDLAKEGTS